MMLVMRNILTVFNRLLFLLLVLVVSFQINSQFFGLSSFAAILSYFITIFMVEQTLTLCSCVCMWLLLVISGRWVFIENTIVHPL